MTEALAKAVGEMEINDRLEVVLGRMNPTFGYVTRMNNDEFRLTCRRDTPAERWPYKRFGPPPIFSFETGEFKNDDFFLLTEFNALVGGVK